MKDLLNMFISKMIITNFKGVKKLTIDFKDITNIYAANGGFKTTIADAWFWVLYGKDSHDRKDFNIKNTVDTSLNRGDHEVEIHLTTGRNTDVFKRVFREKWTKPKGQKDQVYSGNENLFYCNDVPMQAKEYAAKIDEIIAEGALKLLTNPNHFNSLKWTERRNILFELAGNVSDEEIAQARPEFITLLESLSNKTLKGYKNEIAVKKKKLKDDLTAIPHRIDELNRSLPEVQEYDAIEVEISVKNAEIALLDASMTDTTKAYNTKFEAIQVKQTTIHNLKTKLNSIRHRVQVELTNAANDIKNKRIELANKVQDAERDIKSKTLLIESSESKVKDLEVKTQQLRVDWSNKNSEQIKFKEGEFECPACRREFETEDIESKKSQLETNFNSAKERELNVIVANANNHAKEVTSTNDLVAILKSSLEKLKAELEATKSELSEFDEKNAVPIGGVSIDFKLAKDHEYVQIEGQLTALEGQPEDKPEIDLSEIKEQKRLISIDVDGLKSHLTTKIQRENALKRVSELENEESNLSQQIADLENIEFSINEFTRARIETTEARINGMFKYVTFKMFNIQVNGEEDETCETMYKGVPFSDLNTAGKIWAGIDIINTLSRHYGLSAPIFLDNRESVTMIPEINAQLINLIVSPEDKTLRVA
ncbi:AAA family ATPase [Pedobacter gandavensis]|uniref:AAA family ATPase n=1 Tax=Pedobacter gandavensis TaxID=2679963 RepID=A0ABR6EU92_9SPHI|nr:AAA family ATPase [Pedobacter gandavensis]MBB2148836.1 AAA family ATPase [Pedobacter gandavensis]